jgi:hypothetical protein
MVIATTLVDIPAKEPAFSLTRLDKVIGPCGWADIIDNATVFSEPHQMTVFWGE